MHDQMATALAQEAPAMLSALDLVRRGETGELTPRAMLELCAEAIEARESQIGAFTVVDLAAARAAAEDPTLGQAPLRGLPVGVKDVFDTFDLVTEYGAPRIYGGHRPRADASLVALVRRAGGVVLGKTVTTELQSLEPSLTRNPRNVAHTPGGSSSGSAAAVAAGMLPLALGSQTAGSIIRPASYCGVAGYKPSFRLLPTVGMKGFAWSLDTAGLFAASVADAAFGAAAITGRELRIDRDPVEAPRIALVRTAHWGDATPAMQDAVERAVRTSEAAGARVRDVELPAILLGADAAQRVVQDYEGALALAYEFDRHRHALGPTLRAQLETAAMITPQTYDEARRLARRARQCFADLMAETDIILTPSAPGSAPRGLGSTGLPTFNRLWTLLGAPCVNVPGLVDAAGLPLGVQVVGRFARDRIALRAAWFIERALARPPK